MLASRFAQLRAQNEKALVLFVTAGDPSLGELPRILDALAEGGADIIELGIPFSDPIADGPTIQASSQRALDRGVTPTQILEALKSWSNPRQVPVILMGYLNPALRQGFRAFAADAKAAGAAGVLLTDLPPDEAEGWMAAAREAGLETVFLVAPTSTEDRLRSAAEKATGFIYAVSRTGVTGAESAAGGSAAELVARVRQHTNRPVCVGFGISRPDQVREVAGYADGVIVGSSLVTMLAETWNGGEGAGAIIAFVRDLKAATREL